MLHSAAISSHPNPTPSLHAGSSFAIAPAHSQTANSSKSPHQRLDSPAVTQGASLPLGQQSVHAPELLSQPLCSYCQASAS